MIARLLTLVRRIFSTPARTAAAQPRQARLVNILTWITFFGALGYLLIQVAGSAGRTALVALILIAIFLIPSRLLLQRGNVAPAGAILIAGYFITSTLGVAAGTGISPTLYVVYLFTIVAATLILGRRVGLITTAAVVAVGFITTLLTGQTALVEDTTALNPLALGTLFAVGALLFVALVYLSDESITRALAEARASGEALQRMTTNLEARVAEQTRDLRLAAEIGQNVAQIRDIDRLLERTVSLVRERFDLYFTQIYLPDSAGRSLVMRAGTGDVGRQLLERGHRLPLTLDSINGTAAVERRAVVVADTYNSATFRANDLLPLTRSEMAVPLIAAERVVGVLNLQSTIPGALSESILPVFEALAGQLAVAIDNAGLFAATRAARDELAAQSRRLVDAGWRNFLNGIERREQLGFTYDRVAIFPVIDPDRLAGERATVAVPISVAGRTVGRVQIDTGSNGPLGAADMELVDFVAQQVAQQVESLRLLAEAEKYRAEAETIVRQATREAWHTFQKVRKLPDFHYDGQQVVTIDQSAAPREGEEVAQPLTVLGEEIGEILIPADALQSEESVALVRTVAERLSVHLENLRLNQQTEYALTQTEALYQGSDRVVRATSIHQTLEALVASTALKAYEWSSVAFFDHPWGETRSPNHQHYVDFSAGLAAAASQPACGPEPSTMPRSGPACCSAICRRCLRMCPPIATRRRPFCRWLRRWSCARWSFSRSSPADPGTAWSPGSRARRMRFPTTRFGA